MAGGNRGECRAQTSRPMLPNRAPALRSAR